MVAHTTMALKALARSASLVFLGLTAVIVAGEPAFSLSQLTGTESAQLAVFAAGCLALVAAWKWPVCGGLAALTLLSLFCLINLTRTGHLPLGWMFALMAIAATLFVASGWASGRRAPRMG